MKILWVSVGIFGLLTLGKSALLYFMVLFRLRSFRLRPPQQKIVPRDQTPEALGKLLGSVEPELERLGFEFVCAAEAVPQEGEAYKAIEWIYENRAEKVIVSVNRLLLQSGVLPICSFSTHLQDGRRITTSRTCMGGNSTQCHLLNPVSDLSLEEQYRSHLAFTRAHAQGAAAVLVPQDNLESVIQENWTASMQEKLGRGRVVRAGEGQFAYTLSHLIPHTQRLLALTRRLSKSKFCPANPQTQSPADQQEQYRQLCKQVESGKTGTATKLVMLIVSMGLFLLAFRLSLSWKNVLILLGVLSFHEGGHLLGMRLCGYSNLRMLFLPFLGAVAIGGKREQVRPWQELVVLFMGPLPGFFIGLLILLLPLRFPASHEVGLMLIGLNVFNLFPIHPLDGGQIWDILLFRRFPFCRVAFLALSAFALFAAGAFGPLGTALGVVGILLLMQIPAQLRQASLVRSLRKKYGETLPAQAEEVLLSEIFQFLQGKPWKMALGRKYQFVKGLLGQCKSYPAGAGEFILGFAAYTSPIWLTLALVLGQNFHKQMAAKTAMAQAKASGLLAMPSIAQREGEVDASPILAQISKVLREKDVDLKLQAVSRHLAEKTPDWGQLGKAIHDPDVATVLGLARKAATADFVKVNQGEGLGTSYSEVPRWLGLSAQCAAGAGDAATAWNDMELALQSIHTRTLPAGSFSSMAADGEFLSVSRRLEKVMRLSPPTTQQIGKIRELLDSKRLARTLLANRLERMIQLAQFSEERFSAPTSGLRDLPLSMRLAAWTYRPPVMDYMEQIRDLRRRLQLAQSESNVSEEALFHSPDSGPRSFAGSAKIVLTRLRLANAALALEDYRIAHGNLPQTLSEVSTLKPDQAELISWDVASSRLKLTATDHSRTAGALRAGSASALGAANREEEDESGEGFGTGNPFATWKLSSGRL